MHFFAVDNFNGSNTEFSLNQKYFCKLIDDYNINSEIGLFCTNINNNMCQQGILKICTMNESLASPPSTMDRSRMKKLLSFGIVEIRLHQIMPDPVSTTNGPLENRVPIALTLSWKSAAKSEVVTVQDFEINRLLRTRAGVRPLDAQERLARLMKAGYKLKEICEAQDPTRKSKRGAPSKRGVSRSCSDSDSGGKKCNKGTLMSLMKHATKKMGHKKLGIDSAKLSLAKAA